MCNVTPPQPGQPPSRYSRKNGFSLPINYLQVTAWGAEVFLAFLLFGVEILALPKQVWTPVFLCMGVIYVAHGLSLLIATAINPADDNAKQRLNNRQGPLPTFDRTKHNHVIENSYCHICEVSVKMKSKHCSACNKCVAVFDHHCKWLNNCVGEKNYKVFLFTVISALVLGLGMLVISLFVFIHAVQNFTGLNSDVWWKTPTATLIAFDVLIAVKVVITLLCLILLFQLFFFHMMLVYKGLTTYDYIKRNLARSAAKQVSRSSSPSPSMENGAICNAPLEIVENTQPDPNLVGQNVATVDVNQGGTVKSDLPKHALLKGSKIKNYGENPCNEPEISSHKNHVFVNDSSEKPVQFSNSQNNKLSSLNYSHKSNLNKSKFEENKESVELPHVVPDSSETSRQKRQTKVAANNKSRPLPPLVVNANCKFLSENQANLKKLPPIASNIPVV